MLNYSSKELEWMQNFATHLKANGYQVALPIVPNGKPQRCHTYSDKPGSKNGWYKYFNTTIAFATYGNWRTGDYNRWCSTDLSQITSAERQKMRKALSDAHRSAEINKAREQYLTSLRGQKIWKAANLAYDTHPYLIKKCVRSHGLRQWKGNLVMPFYANGQLTTLQFIDWDGTKRWLSGGQKKGSCFGIGTPGATVCIAEGYATGASIFESTGYATFVAGDAGNLRWVAEAVWRALPHATIIICADNDINTPGNPGLKKAKEAAEAVGGRLTIAGDSDARL